MANLKRSTIGTICFAALPISVPAAAQSLNYDTLASLEEPLAFEIGDATVQVKGVADVPVMLNVDNRVFEGDVNVTFTGNVEVSAEMQLGNRWNIGAIYFGQYSEDANEYSDNVAGFIRTSWGTVIGGNVSGLVRESTRRRRGVGNANLAFDDFYGGLARWGGGYSGRFGPVTMTSIVDENGDFEVGGEFQRPIGVRDMRFATRMRKSRYLTADETTQLSSEAVGAVGEIVYGSSLFDLGVGYENLNGSGLNLDRWFVSGGGQHKVGSISFSAAGHYGELDGSAEYSTAFGVGYDIARGLSTNLGFNTRKANVERNNIQIVDEDEKKATASIRYSF